MHYCLKSLSLATATLLLSLTSPLLPLTLKFEPLVAQAQTIEQQEPGAEKWFLEAYQLWIRGEYPAALEKLQQDLVRFRKEGDRAREGAVLTYIGIVYRSMGQYTQALEYSQNALAILREVGKLPNSERSTAHTWEGRTLNNIGLVYSYLGQYSQALEYSQQALAINREVGDRIWEGRTLNSVGLIYDSLGQYAKALEFYQQALTIVKEIGDKVVEGTNLSNISFLLEAQNQPELAIVFLKQSVNVTEAIRKDLRVLPIEQQQSFTETVAHRYRRLADLLLKQDRVLEAQRVLDLLKVQELDDYLRNVRGNNNTAQGLPNLPPEQQAWTSYQTILNKAVEIGKELTQLRQLKQQNGTLTPAQEQRIAQLVKAQEMIREEFNNFTKSPEVLALVTQKSPEILSQDLLLQMGNFNALQDNLRNLQQNAVLYDGQQWLVQRYRINNITAASLTDLNTKPQPQMQVLAGAFATGRYSFTVGGQFFDFAGLPFAGTEVENLAKTVPTTTQFIDKAFTPQVTVPKMDDYTIVHLATHAAFVVGTPDESFILFGNGERITLRDMQNWSLKNVDLVVLSACETGLGGKLGNGEEILGLGYQIQRAGARAVVASLWTVDDGGTQALMNTFYANLKKGNTTKAEALRQAQIALITGDLTAIGKDRGLGVEERNNTNPSPPVTNRLSHPFYWAPFILIGNGL